MSARFYPRFVKGNPQLRIFLPDWKMTLIKSPPNTPDNIVCFKVDPRMTDWDIKNYLEKIYKVPVGAVNSSIWPGKLKELPKGQLTKEYDYRIARVTLPIGQTFKWPDLFPKEKFEEEQADYQMTIKELEKGRTINSNLRDIPSWFL